MNKIPFENGTLVTPAKVNEDNTITPAVYEGSTPLTAHNLNLLQDNIETEMVNSGVVVNSTEPTDNRKKVWLQKGDNLFDNVFRQGSTLTNSLNNTTRIFSQMSIPLKANKTYKIYSDLDFNTYKFGFYTSTLKFPLSDSDELKTDSGWQYNSNVSYTPSEDEFMGIQVARIDNGNLVPTDISNFIFRIEIEKVIYVKNDNDVYEEFVNVDEVKNDYSLAERRIGTWIDGKPLYRKVVTGTFGTVTQDIESTLEIKIPNANFVLVKDLWLDRRTNSSAINQGQNTDVVYLGYTTVTSTECTVRIRSKQSWASNTTVYAIIEYTKSTDVATTSLSEV